MPRLALRRPARQAGPGARWTSASLPWSASSTSASSTSARSRAASRAGMSRMHRRSTRTIHVHSTFSDDGASTAGRERRGPRGTAGSRTLCLRRSRAAATRPGCPTSSPRWRRTAAGRGAARAGRRRGQDPGHPPARSTCPAAPRRRHRPGAGRRPPGSPPTTARVHPREVRAAHRVRRDDAPRRRSSASCTATANAVALRRRPPLLAHLFSMLPKIGLDEDDGPPMPLLADLAARTAAGGRAGRGQREMVAAHRPARSRPCAGRGVRSWWPAPTATTARHIGALRRAVRRTAARCAQGLTRARHDVACRRGDWVLVAFVMAGALPAAGRRATSSCSSRCTSGATTTARCEPLLPADRRS